MWSRPRYSLFFLTLLLLSCGKEMPTLQGVNIEKWKADKNGCLGYRQSIKASLASEISKLKGLAEMDVIRLLGKPDQNELYKRNQKFYSYFISPGPSCITADSASQKLVLRFNAMGYAQLVSMERD